MREGRELSRVEVVGQLRGLGVRPGAVLVVHTSFRAVRPVEGGPSGLIQALLEALGPQGTLVMPSWPGDDDVPFDAEAMPVAEDLGVVAEMFRRSPGAVRSKHPFAFAAIGPQAEAVTQGPMPLPPHGPESPVGRVHALDGQVLLLGVGHDADTTVHLGEVLGGAPYRVPRHCTVMREGRPVRVEYGENDSCCERFPFLDAWLGELQRTGPVGHAQARLAASRDIVRVTVERVAREPLVFLHPPEYGCGECAEARSSIPGQA